MHAEAEIRPRAMVVKAQDVGAYGKEGREGFEGSCGVCRGFDGNIAAVDDLTIDLVTDGECEGTGADAGNEADFINPLLAGRDGDGPLDPAATLVGGDGVIGVFFPCDACFQG